jgi:hypothetical protein
MLEKPQDFSKLDDAAVASYENWVSRRAPDNLSTNAGAPLIAFQGWRQFKEAFAPELVQVAISETAVSLGRSVRSCLDPFGGSGTTALTCQFLGILPTTIEVNPFLADLIAAKLSQYNFERLPALMQRVTDSRVRTRFPRGPFPGSATTFVEPGHNGRFIFPKDVAERLSTLLSRIDKIDDLSSQRLFRVMLASAAISVSNVVVSGKGRRYRRNWENALHSTEDVDHTFIQNCARAIYDLRRFRNRVQMKAKLIRGDARVSISKSKQVDLAIFSPPYPSSFDYTDVYNVELWAGGYLRSAQDNRDLRMKTIRSHVQIARDFASGDIDSKTLKRTIRKLKAARGQLWNKHIPEMIGAYFADMNTIFTELHHRIVAGGRVYAVFGDSRYAGIDVPVARTIAEMLAEIGYRIERSIPFRSMRASPQQGGMPELPETLIVATRL